MDGRLATIDFPAYRYVDHSQLVLQSFIHSWQYTKYVESFPMIDDTPMLIEYGKPHAISARLHMIRIHRLRDFMDARL